MDSLLKQTRVRFSDQEPGKQLTNTRDRRTVPQKAVSFKGDKKGKNWLQRQFSDRMSRDDNSSDCELETAIAAATYAVSSLKEGSHKKKPVEGQERSATRTKSHKEDNTKKLADAGRITKWFSIKDAKEDKSSSEVTGKMMERSRARQKMPEKGTSATPSMEKTPTFPDKYLNDTGSKRYEIEKQKPTVPDSSLTRKPTTSWPSSANSKNWTGYPTESNTKVKKADAWEETGMDKIKKRFEKMNATVLEWENKKKTKAKHKLEKKERKLELNRARALQEYRNDISRIDKIAGEARALAEERKRNDEAKLREKARKIRMKRTAPTTCFGYQIGTKNVDK